MVGSKKFFVLDASVILKWITEEKDSRKAFEIRSDFFDEKINLGIASHTFTEVVNTVARKFPEKAPGFFMDLLDLGMTEYRTDLDIVFTGTEIMQKCEKVSFYDTVYHALALKFGGTFITADEDYYKKAKKLGGIKLLKDYR